MSTPSAARPPCVALISSTIDMRFLEPTFRQQHPQVELRIGDDLGPLEDIDAAVCWYPPHGLLATLPRLQLIQSLAAGIDHVLADPHLPQAIPLCRMTSSGMSSGMAAYVTWAVIDQQRQMASYRASQMQAEWKEQPVVLPGRHRVGIAGLGTLGMACAQALTTIGFPVLGWSRSPKSDLPPGVTGYHGADQLKQFLAGCDTLVCLLPLTAETTGFLNAELFAAMPRGAHLINVGRGGHLVEADLLAALADGQLSSATLDTVSLEPLPADHPFWREPRIVITPHVATRTDLAVIAAQTVANLASLRAGQKPATQVEPGLGY